MDNIEKFKKIKKLNQLRTELHKQEIASYFKWEKYHDLLPPNWRPIVQHSDIGLALVKVIKPFIISNQKP